MILWYELNPGVRCAFGNVYLEVLPSTMEEDAASLLSALLTYQPSKRTSARYRSEFFKIRVAHCLWLAHMVNITGMHCSTASWPTPPSFHPPCVEVRKAFLAISRKLKRRSKPGWALWNCVEMILSHYRIIPFLTANGDVSSSETKRPRLFNETED